MLEVRYNTDNKNPTAWCGDEAQFGNLDRGLPDEAIVVLDIPIPSKPMEALLYDEATQSLIPNPDYIEPVYRDFGAEIDEMKAKMIVSEPTGDEVKITNLVYDPLAREIHHKGVV